MSYALLCGISVADLKGFSLGFMIELCTTYGKLKRKQDLHKDEKRFSQLKDIYPFVLEDYKSKKITKEKYNEFLTEYRRLEGLYGC